MNKKHLQRQLKWQTTFSGLLFDNEDIYMKCFLEMEDDVFGVIDSVKKFKFYKESGSTLLNDFTIVLSKHYGLLSFLDFYDLEFGNSNLEFYIKGSFIININLIF